MIFQTTGLPLIVDPPLGFRFGVVFFANGKIPNPIDIRFKSVTGLGVSMELEETGKSTTTSVKNRLAKNVTYEQLVLERGVLVGSPLSILVEKAFNDMKATPANVLVSVLNEAFLPVKTWMFYKAYPVGWSISGIDAAANDVLIEKIELSYSHFTTFSL